MMAIPKDSLQVTGASYTRTFDLTNNGNGHMQQPSEMDRPEKVLEVSYPHGNLAIIRPSGNPDYIMVQNNVVIHTTSKKGRRGKKPLLHLDFDGKREERYWEDGTLIYVPNGSPHGHSTPPLCKVSVQSKEETNQQEFVITFTSSGDRPQAQTQPVENAVASTQDPTSPPNQIEVEKNAGQGPSNGATFQRIKQITSDTVGEKRKKPNNEQEEQEANDL